ncbi:MAG: TolC family protein [Prevotella sp.]|nr:TolC family protein [Prevotella sp.]
MKVQGWVKVLPFYLFTLLPSNAQQPWTLEQCIDYAVTHNISIKQYENRQRQQELQLSTARWQRLPDLNASASENFSFGRGLTSENTYTNTNTSSTSFSLGTSIPLLTGNRIPKNIELSRLNLEASTQDLEKAKNDIRVQVAQQYVQVLYDMEISGVARRQVAIDSAQVARLESLLKLGRASEAEVAQQRAALAQSRLTVTQADNNTQLALLSLSQLLELPSPEGFSISSTVAVADSSKATGRRDSGNLLTLNSSLLTLNFPLPSPDAIYAEALAIRPEIQAEKLRLKGADANIDIARSSLFPSLSFSAGLGSNYYKTSGFPADDFSKQMKNNFSQYLGFNLSVPIFNRFSVRNNIRSAKIDRENQLLSLDNTKKQLYKEIQTAYYNTLTSRQKLQSSEEAYRSSKTAFSLMQAKYEVGKATSTEFNEARANLLKTESDLTQARYEYLYQTALIQFYRGQPLHF